MTNAAHTITAADLIGVRVERLARYGEAGVGAVVEAESNSFSTFIMTVILEDGRRIRGVRYDSMFEPNPVFRFVFTAKADAVELAQLEAGAAAKEFLAAMTAKAKVSAYAGEMAKIADMFAGIELQAHAVKRGNLKARVHYSASVGYDGRKSVSIYSKDYDRTLGEIFKVGYKNDTDSQTDYFDKGRVSIYEGHPLYTKAVERVKLNDAALEARREKKDAARAERANARFQR
jgi:hypothetical protein